MDTVVFLYALFCLSVQPWQLAAIQLFFSVFSSSTHTHTHHLYFMLHEASKQVNFSVLSLTANPIKVLLQETESFQWIYRWIVTVGG